METISRTELDEWQKLYRSDPYGFALAAFPWDVEHSPIYGRHLEPWQQELLESVRDRLKTPAQAIREATVSGNGVGKSALVSILIIWALTTADDTRGVITANTETQLKTKTWAELGKWFNMLEPGVRDCFKLTATAMFSRFEDKDRVWRIDMVPWSENNVVAFQGLHNEGKRILMIYDEASGIPDGIWEAGDGCMTDANTERIWCVFGNPNLPKGRFRECFAGGKFSGTWHSRKVDSRTISFTDKGELERWVKEWGEDNDFVRVRVRGEFPRAGTMQFISDEVAANAAEREASIHIRDPLVLGVDVARFGDDQSVIYFRKGRDGRTLPPLLFRGIDTMTLAGKVSEVYLEYRADAVFVDGGGVGGGVVDRLRQLHVPVLDVQFGGKPDGLGFLTGDEGVKYANKRAEIWGAMRQWLSSGGIIPNDPELRSQLTNLQYGFNVNNAIQLEKKEDMKKRGLSSPDIADALAITFAQVVIPHAHAGGTGPHDDLVEHEYNPFDPKYMAA
ncbi:MAG TPA: terminase [Candidatus Bathyarchaeia archaeon]|nr:terminase [Candidatus Bathyarchaeia archaeon]